MNADTYQWPIDDTFSILSVIQNKWKKLFVWHFQLSHLNFIIFCKYLKQLLINFLYNVSQNFVCGPYKLSKASKQYNRSLWLIPTVKYTEIYTDLVGSITSWGFLGENYFFTFIDRATREIKTYTGKEKSE